MPAVKQVEGREHYWGYAELRRIVPRGMLVSTGEQEATRWGLRRLLEMECRDLVQPGVGWCGGITELAAQTSLPPSVDRKPDPTRRHPP